MVELISTPHVGWSTGDDAGRTTTTVTCRRPPIRQVAGLSQTLTAPYGAQAAQAPTSPSQR
jgi:hypothetical protein